MSEIGPKDVDALLDCERAFDALGAPQPGDAALLERAIGSTLAATPTGTGSGGAAGGMPTTFLMAIVGALVVLVALAAWPSGDTHDARAEAVTHGLDPKPEPVAQPVRAEDAETVEPVEPVADEVDEPEFVEPIAVPPPTATAPPPKPRPPSLSPAQLLERANAARRASEGRRALALYGRLFKEHPRSREAATARVSAGRLYLDQGQAKAALAQFRKYLSATPRGSLAEEAAAGRAMALGKLGRSEAEREAWTSLLDNHPDSVHTARANKRIAELSGG